jgi:hypothetical protein
MSLNGLFRDAEQGSDLAILQPDEESELDHFGLLGVLGGKQFQRLVDPHDCIVVAGAGQFDGVQVHTFELAAVFAGLAATRAIHENAPHHLGSHGIKLLAILPTRIGLLREPQPRLMHKGGGLKCLAGHFLSHFVRGEAAQFVIDEGQQFLRGPGITLLNAVVDAGDIAHAADSSSVPCRVLAILAAASWRSS